MIFLSVFTSLFSGQKGLESLRKWRELTAIAGIRAYGKPASDQCKQAASPVWDLLPVCLKFL